VGVASLYRGGLTISGKRAQGAQVQFWILLALFATVPFVRPAYLWLLGWFLAALGLECWRKQDTIALGWADIEEVHFTQHYRLLCIVYRQTDPKGRIRRYSITPKFSPSDFDAFSAAIYKNASPNVTILPKGKLTLFCGSAAAYAFLAGIVALAIVSWCGRFSLDSITPR